VSASRQRRGEVGDAVEGLVQPDLVLVALAGEIAGAIDRQALDQQPGRHAVVGRQHEPGIELFGLQHVVLQHLRELLQGLARVTVQGHDALVRLLAGLLVQRIERDGAATLAVHVEHRFELCTGRHLADHLGGGAKRQVGLHLGDGQLDGTVAVHLQDQRAVELDVGLHQRGRRGHLAEQGAHRRRERVVGRLAALEQFLPGPGQPYQHAAHRQALEDELVQLRHQPTFFRPRR
jgi:hypothetical protein